MNMLLMRQENYEACMSVHAAIALIPLVMCRSRQRKISDGHAHNAAQPCCSSEQIEEQSEYNAGRANKKKERRDGVHAACLQGVFKSWLQSRGYASSERCVCCAALQNHALACLWHALCPDCLAIAVRRQTASCLRRHLTHPTLHPIC